VKGIEPSYEAWEAAVLPLNYTRSVGCILARRHALPFLFCPAHTALFMTMPPVSAPVSAPPSAPEAAASPHPHVRSFVVRAGRMGSGQKRALDELAPRYVLPFQTQALDWPATFGRSAPRVLEIGFGMGDATAQVAAAQPEKDFIGIEVHPPGVGALLERIEALDLRNLRILQHDAVQVLEQMIPAASLSALHIWFPDPWPKKRHHKRRLIQPAFVAELARRLAPGGILHCSTDWQPYAEQMLEVLSAEPALQNTAGPELQGYAPRPAWRPRTKFETRGLNLGHGVWDLVFTRP
jgi:tRNA (guanine-N7-)-methyltransferase